MSEPTTTSGTPTARLVVSGLVVGRPLVHGRYLTIRSVLRLFGG